MALDRRDLLKAAAASLALTACGGPASTPALVEPDAPAEPAPPRPPPPAAPTPPGLPVAARYAPHPAEVLPALKQTAADFVQAITTRAAGRTPDDVLAAVADRFPGFDAVTAAAIAAPLFEGVVSSGEVVYPQYGGLAPDGPLARRSSIMAVVRQTLLSAGGATRVVTRTFDVRLEAVDGTWQVRSLLSIGGEPVDRPASLDPAAVAVLDDPRIDLPDSARWDVHAGRVSPQVLEVLADAATLAPLGVCVLRTGHPVHVFDTDRTSAHTLGRAVDVWRVGDAPVVAQAAQGSPMRAVLDRAFADRRVTQTGSPAGTDLDGRGRRSFTDVVHSDHLHLAAGGSPPNPG